MGWLEVTSEGEHIRQHWEHSILLLLYILVDVHVHWGYNHLVLILGCASMLPAVEETLVSL